MADLNLLTSSSLTLMMDLRQVAVPCVVVDEEENLFPEEFYHQKQSSRSGSGQWLVPNSLTYQPAYSSSARDTSDNDDAYTTIEQDEPDQYDLDLFSRSYRELERVPGSDTLPGVASWAEPAYSKLNHLFPQPGGISSLPSETLSYNGPIDPALLPEQPRVISRSEMHSLSPGAAEDVGYSPSPSLRSYPPDNVPTPAVEEHLMGPQTASPQTREQGQFRCFFACYGCQADPFASKNELKRHVMSQHIQAGGYKCDLCQHEEEVYSTMPPPNGRTSRKRAASQKIANDHKVDKIYNRKDLFVHHVWRMHLRTGKGPKETYHMSPELEEIAQRCYIEDRPLPQKSNCGYCNQVFEGKDSFTERMEHVGKHIEKHDTLFHEVDPDLEQWAIQHGVIVQSLAQNWVLAERKGHKGHKRSKSSRGSTFT